MNNVKLRIGIAVGVLVVISVLIVPRTIRHFHIKEAEELMQREIPTVHYPLATDHSSDLPAEINLPVPFTTQAPHANWDMPYQEACEETAVLMAIRYVFGNSIIDEEDADKGILDLVRANEIVLGYPVDQTAAQVLDLILEVDPEIPARLLEKPTVDDLKLELSKGNVIIVPAAGRELGNPFFQHPGPRYHMFVLRGYTSDGYFITNDPGTRRGEGYLYKFETIMSAMGDWDSDFERKVVIVVEQVDAE